MASIAAALLIQENLPRRERADYLPLGRVSKWHVLLCAQSTILYFVLLIFAAPGEIWLWLALLATQLFRVSQILSYCHTVWPRAERPQAGNYTNSFAVDIMVTTIGEDLEVLERTVRAALNQDYVNSKVYVLNDAFVKGNPQSDQIEQLALRLGATCITRTRPGGGKAGNLNHALLLTKAPIIAVLDSDHVPLSTFLSSLIPYFDDEQTAVVQSPQYYRNSQVDLIPNAAWAQQRVFFSAVLNGKDASNSAFMCGTNMLVRRSALQQVSGFDESCVAEDFATSICLHSRGWRTKYIPAVLASGLAPEDMPSYYRQQLRWARGSLGAALKCSVWRRPGLSGMQKLQYLASASYYLSGVATLVESLFPVVAFFVGATPLGHAGPVLLAALGLSLLASASLVWKSTAGALTPALVSFAISGFMVHVQALLFTIFGVKAGFAVTSKTRLEGNFLRFVLPHLLYILVVGIGCDVAIRREGFTPVFLINLWLAVLNIVCFIPFIAASLDVNFGGSTLERLRCNQQPFNI